MITNYFKIAWRNLHKNKVYAFVHITGLGIGVGTVILLFSLIYFEMSHDTFHTNAPNIYRLVRQVTFEDGSINYTSGTSLPVIDALKQDIPQFEKVVPLCGTIEPQITVLGRDPKSTNTSIKFTEEGQGICAGPEFFELFDFKWLMGTPQSLKEPNVVVLSKKYAIKYFSNYESAVGQYLKVNNVTTMRVVGILEDIPLNTDFPIDIVFSYQSKRRNPNNFGFGSYDDWGSTSSMDNIYVQLPENFSLAKANTLLANFTKKHFEGRTSNDKKAHWLVPLSTVHFDERFSNYKDRTISKTKLGGIAFVGVLIILMACINFINISTAIATKRAKEVGVRKTLGSANRQLVGQFMTETVFLVSLSIGLGLLIAYLSRPLLHNLFDFPQDVNLFNEPMLWVFLASLLVFISLLSGIYPASILASFSPLEAFRQKAKLNWVKGMSLRKALIVFQFAIALIMIIGTIVNIEQMHFINNMEMGFKKEGVYTFATDTEYKARFEVFKNKLQQLPEVKSVTFSNDEPSSENFWESNFAYDNLAKDADFNTHLKFADPDYFTTYGLTLVAGTPYSATDTGQVRKFVVNETLLKKVGVKNPALAIGKMLRLGGQAPKPIVGVVKDFQVGSARDEMKPMAIMAEQRFYWRSSVKIQSTDLQNSIAKIEKIYSEVFPEVVFSGSFYEEKLNNFYKAEQQMGLLYRIAALLSVFIASLGVFGLVTFVAEQRVKEIGIRKVLGASTGSITLLISQDFIKLSLVAMVIAFPIAFFIMDKWLQDFVLRIQLQWWYFVLAGAVALTITLISVSYQSIRAALMDPVKSLKTE